MKDFANQIADICLKKYESLKKNGKPTENEWTVLSGIVLKNPNGTLVLISLATGTKCLGGSELLNTLPNERGSKLHDSHAEVLARRGFLRYLYKQIDLVLNDLESDILFLNDVRKFKLREGISFHFFSTQTPCGDCSIFPKDVESDETPPHKIRRIVRDEKHVPLESQDSNEILNVGPDIFRTGAKCVEAEKQKDPKMPGIDYHVVGPLRTKPGRGDPTLSLSCSDKIAKWNILGIQGSLLSLLLPKVNIETVTIARNCPFSFDAMERGLYKRFNGVDGPKILRSQCEFMHGKTINRTRPCPSSIIWCNVPERNLEVAVEGRKQGTTKKRKGENLLVSRQELFKIFLSVCDKYYGIEKNLVTHPKKATYYDFKHWSNWYQNSWKQMKSGVFSTWPDKPLYLQNFII